MIIYRDVRTPRPTAFRVPTWLEGAMHLVRQTIAHRCHFWIGSAIVQPDVPEKAWRDAGDDFQVAIIGDITPSELLRVRHDLHVVEVLDAKGRAWNGLVVLDKDKNLQLSLGWGRDDNGKLRRVPEPWQARLIESADAVRRELDAGTLAQVPVEAAMAWLLPAITELYHLSEDVVLNGRFVDDRLAQNLLRVLAGYAPE